MSGTSLDAVDAALILTDGDKVTEFGPAVERKYTAAERAVLQAATDAARAWNWQGPVPQAPFRAALEVITQTHLDAWRLLTGRERTWSHDGLEAVGALEIRQSYDLRLLDAHEQLVLGPQSAWCGDCMRRNPSERDAFESFLMDEVLLTGWAAKAFERLWAGAEAVNAEGETAVAADGVIVASEQKHGPILAATSRH